MDTAANRSPAPPTSGNYARIARLYRSLEYIAFGRSLEAARSTFLDSLADCRSIAVFGAGDGRCFKPLLSAAPQARFISLDLDAVMTSLAQTHVSRLGAAERVQFVCADVRTLPSQPGTYDGVVTQFFLDCFADEDLQQIVPLIAGNLTPAGPWLFADFAIPTSPPLTRWRAKLWIWVLCSFFRWQTGHSLRSLPPMDAALRRNGFVCERERSRSAGLIRSALYRRGERR